MFGPYALTRVVYVLLVIGFVAVETYMIVYNLRMKRREKAIERGGRHLGSSEGIAAAAAASREDSLRHKHAVQCAEEAGMTHPEEIVIVAIVVACTLGRLFYQVGAKARLRRRH